MDRINRRREDRVRTESHSLCDEDTKQNNDFDGVIQVEPGRAAGKSFEEHCLKATRDRCKILARSKQSKKKRTRRKENIKTTPARRLAGFDTRLEELRAYKRIYGNCLVPRTRETYRQLGHWVQKQRTEYKNWKKGRSSSMNMERFQKLQAIDFVWSIKEQRLKEMMESNSTANRLESVQENGMGRNDAEPKSDSTVKKDFSSNVGQVLGKKSKMEQTTSLVSQKALSMVTTDEKSDTGLEDTQQTLLPDYQPWEVRFEELKKYKEEIGNCDVPSNYKKNRQLGTWVIKQRYQYRLMVDGKLSGMSEEKVNALESVGFTWSKRTVDFESRMAELRAYKHRFGDCLVPRKQDRYQQLGDWVQGQRAQYKKWKEGKPSAMTAARCDELESLGFAWSVNEQWEVRLDQLREHLSQQGRAQIPCNIIRNRPLLLWARRQHQRYEQAKAGKPTTLTSKQMELLRNLGFDYWSEEKQNDENIQEPPPSPNGWVHKSSKNCHELEKNKTRKHDEISTVEDEAKRQTKDRRKFADTLSCKTVATQVSPIVAAKIEPDKAMETNEGPKLSCASNHTPKNTDKKCLKKETNELKQSQFISEAKEDSYVQERADALRLLGFKIKDFRSRCPIEDDHQARISSPHTLVTQLAST